MERPVESSVTSAACILKSSTGSLKEEEFVGVAPPKPSL